MKSVGWLLLMAAAMAAARLLRSCLRGSSGSSIPTSEGASGELLSQFTQGRPFFGPFHSLISISYVVDRTKQSGIREIDASVRPGSSTVG
jgi:hypothetical protein